MESLTLLNSDPLSSTPSKLFNAVWSVIETEIPFNLDWKNGTGYLNGLMTTGLLQLKCGELVKTTDDFNRRVIVVGLTKKLNVVIFERYNPSDNGKDRSTVIVGNIPTIAKLMVDVNGALTYDNLVKILGCYGEQNIGVRMAQMNYYLETFKAYNHMSDCVVEMPSIGTPMTNRRLETI